MIYIIGILALIFITYIFATAPVGWTCPKCGYEVVGEEVCNYCKCHKK